MPKTAARALTALLVTALAVLVLWGGWRALDAHYVYWNGVLISRDTEQLDIAGKTAEDLEGLLELPGLRLLDARGTGLTAEQFRWLQEQLPRCRVLWDVPIQGKFYDQSTRAISVEELTGEELELLQYLPELSCVDVGEWSDEASLLQLQQKYPRCRVLYSVELAGERWGGDAVSVILEDADPQELLRKIPCLPNLQSVLLTGAVPDRQALTQLQETFPDVLFLWKMDVLGVPVETDRTELDLTGAGLEDPEQLREILPYFPGLETVTLEGGELSAEELAALMEEYPDIRFSFDVTLGGRRFSSQSRQIDLSNLTFASLEEVERALPLFPELEKVVMCGCGFSSGEMDALNRKYEDIRFVWSVELGGKLFRTDAVHFTPNRWGLKLTNENIQDLRYCTDMVCVDIGHARNVTTCEWAAYMPGLKYLVLAETGISDISPLAELKELVFLELFLSKVRDYSPLLGCTALEDLNLCYTRGDPAPVGEMTWLKRLWWSGCWKARKTLPEKLTETEMEFSSRSSTGEGWREGQHYYDMRDFIGMKYMTG